MVEKRGSLARQEAVLKRVIRRRMLRFVLSGFIILVVGVCITALGLSHIAHTYSSEVLIVGLGICLLIIGLIRLLLGVINPLLPSDLHALPSEKASEPVDSLFAHEGDRAE